MSRISAVVNTRNEENNIKNCLETLRWCDEIVIVDMESEDRTVDIAREFTNTIYTVDKTGYVETARQFAVDQATGDWILILDADEMIPYELAETLRRLADEDCVDIVEISSMHYIMGAFIEYCGWGYTPIPRFFKKGKINFSSIIHKGIHKIENSTVVRLKNSNEVCVQHFAYRDSRHFVEKLNRYTSIEAQHLYDKQEIFSYYRLLKSSFKEFISRYLIGRGYKEGVRGFSLSFMMGVYSALTYIKLWEQYEFEKRSQDEIYQTIKNNMLDEWLFHKPINFPNSKTLKNG